MALCNLIAPVSQPEQGRTKTDDHAILLESAGVATARSDLNDVSQPSRHFTALGRKWTAACSSTYAGWDNSQPRPSVPHQQWQ